MVLTRYACSSSVNVPMFYCYKIDLLSKVNNNLTYPLNLASWEDSWERSLPNEVLTCMPFSADMVTGLWNFTPKFFLKCSFRLEMNSTLHFKVSQKEFHPSFIALAFFSFVTKSQPFIYILSFGTLSFTPFFLSFFLSQLTFEYLYAN